MVKWIVGHFFLKVERLTEFCFVALRKLSSQPRNFWSLYPTASLDSLDHDSQLKVKREK